MAMEAPLPIAALLRRARNAVSAKERHDAAFYAWEAALRLGVAARSPERLCAEAAPSTGDLVALLGADDRRRHDDPRIRDAARLLKAVGVDGKDEPPREEAGGSSGGAVTAQALLAVLPAYRNRVLGHGSVRAPAFYERAAATLREGLLAALGAGVFWPTGARLLHVDQVEIDDRGRRRARLLDLMGPVASVRDPEGSLGPAADAVPRRLYLELQAVDAAQPEPSSATAAATSARLLPLHPAVVWLERDLKEQVFFFNGRRRQADLLDFASGETLRGKALEAARPGLEAEIREAARAGAGNADGDSGTGDRARRDSGSGGGSGEQPGALAEAAAAADPARIGGFHLLARLGQGALGVVHLARQESMGRLVALKVVPEAQAQDPLARRRFAREVSALARCDHANVVKILASGEDEARRAPFFAMEVVPGADLGEVARALAAEGGDLARAVEKAAAPRMAVIEAAKAVGAAGGGDGSGGFNTEARRAQRGTETDREGAEEGGAEGGARAPVAFDSLARLAGIGRDAARGLHHLHEAGFIHRDVKPENIMVAVEGMRAVVMDLGLAAAAEGGRSLSRSRAGFVGTLRTMPPEQLQEGLLSLDRRADVYALGASLYELACGRPLFEGVSEAELVTKILHEEPLAPAKARRGLPKDLAVILTKALAKDRRFRYESAEALAQDLDAFAFGRPISARPPTFGYLLSLAARRHKAAAAALATALVVAAGGLTGMLVQSERARAREEGLRKRAEESRADAEGLIEYMIGDFREKLEPLEQVGLLVDLHLRAKAYYERPGALEEAVRDPDAAVRRAATLATLGTMLGQQDRLEDGLACLGAAIEVYRALAAAKREGAPLQLADTLCKRANLHLMRGRAREALEDAMAAASGARASDRAVGYLEPWEVEVIAANSAAMSLDLLGRIDEAIAVLDDAIARLKRLRADPEGARAARLDRLLARNLALRANLHYRLADTKGAVEDAEAALAAIDGGQDLTLDPTRALVGVVHRIRTVLESSGRVDQSVVIQERAVAALESAVAHDAGDLRVRADLAVSQARLSESYRFTGRLRDALATAGAASQGLRRLVERDSKSLYRRIQLGIALQTQADLLGDLGRVQEAEPHLAEVEALSRAILLEVPDHLGARRMLAEVDGLRGRGLERAGRRVEAIAASRKAWDALGVLSRESTADTVVVVSLARVGRRLAADLAAEGSPEEARPVAEESVRLLEKEVRRAGPISHAARELSIALRSLGDAHLAAKRLAEAATCYERCRDLARTLHEASPTNVAWLATYGQGWNRLGMLRFTEGRWEEARAAFEESVRVNETLARLSPSDTGVRRDLATNRLKVGDCEGYLGRHAEALAAYRSAVEAIEERLGMGTPNTQAKREGAIVHRRLAAALRHAGEVEAAAVEEARIRELDPPKEQPALEAPGPEAATPTAGSAKPTP